jgi:hypothetical protein
MVTWPLLVTEDVLLLEPEAEAPTVVSRWTYLVILAPGHLQGRPLQGHKKADPSRTRSMTGDSL